MKIAIGLSFYQDYDSLKRMIASLQPYPIDLLIAVDGRYADYPVTKISSSLLSSDECLDLIRNEDINKIPYKVIDGTTDEELLTQERKRDLYFSACDEEDIDCLIVMDSDEYFLPNQTKWNLFMEDLRNKIRDNAHTYKRAYTIPVSLRDKGIEKMPDGYFENLPRLFHKPYELKYVDDHFSIRNKKTGVLVTREGNTLLNHIAIGHDHNLRPKEYTANTKKYEEFLTLQENETRERKQDDFIRTIQSSS